ncbi:hypothetical protein RhiirA1_392555 [Rhizophagus irregularis]|uniref:Uncharacterized protein n=3 Tax=Rhizophagus irregularis TaxID=588596 RepID=A0A2I1ECY7_9GLOM|nr:hypothetical protein GLOIN_2v1683371 [Rhizophagus irregularis DAOM 181602=DAOM 197198]PKC68890.1 hypothetical protein RhiirA1_392555 [Rhizophagus irregularis]PKY19980.1 hypothetical protein RhiirB3_384516 [Rhizophagus irregularis]POG63683.1 hypothetical protein GLOIN_2v1683371 [Rhizophagus irregularis DAOM 181602=DAOM 197198]UZO28024.1 hypothetical protein OCT59_021569 [Rhizophagus irregularis]CAB4495948.1 unnamed protein product [Rhizophagus irregularis]|eukprot:XP_025170549.1 hypothetical protein GLOIN_2v1683371 [Rhizophagus irregularis DAOM 181602=DAOM 197198]
MADTNYFYDIEIFSLTSTTQNPLHLLADAAFISENTNNSNKLTQHEIPSHYTKCSTNCSDYNREMFGKSATSNYSTNLTDNNETMKLEQKKIKPIKSGHNTNIKTNSQIKSSNDDCLNTGFSTLSKNSSISDLNFNSNKQDFRVRSLAVEFKYDKEKIQLLEPNSVASKNQDIKNPFHLFNNGKIIEDIKKPISLSSNDKSKDDDIKRPISLISNDKSKDDVTKKLISLPSNDKFKDDKFKDDKFKDDKSKDDKSKDDNIKKPVSLSSNNKSKDNNIKKPIQLSNKNSRRKITKKQNNAERKKKRIVKNHDPSQLRIHAKTYTTRSNRISKPPSASSAGGRWTGS